MKKAVIYARFSHGGNQTYQSIEGQLTSCRKFAKENNLQIVQVYEDASISGKTDRRPAFQQMLKDSKTADWEIVLVYAIDRFGRNSVEITMNKQILQNNGKAVISATQRTAQNVDGTKNLDGILLEQIYIGMAEYYSEELAQKIHRGLQESWTKGNFTGGYVPYGYKVIVDERSLRDKKPRKLLVVEEEAARVVQFIFTEYAKGTSKKDILEELHKANYKNARGKHFTLSSLQPILCNSRYTGECERYGITYTNIYPKIIEKELFAMVQKQLSKNKHKAGANKAKDTYLLSGKAYCGHCGANIIGVSGTGKSGVIYRYYACGEQYRKHTCDKKHEQKEALETLIVKQTIEQVLTPEKMEFIAEKIAALHNSEFNTDNITALKQRLIRLDLEKEKTVQAFIDADRDMRPALNAKANDIEAQRQEVEAEIAGLEAGIKMGLDKDTIIAFLSIFKHGDITDEKFRKRVIQTLVNRVYIYDDKIVLYFNVTSGSNEELSIDVQKDIEETAQNSLDGGFSVRIFNNLVEQVV